jgi:hypothetical protein
MNIVYFITPLAWLDKGLYTLSMEIPPNNWHIIHKVEFRNVAYAIYYMSFYKKQHIAVYNDWFTGRPERCIDGTLTDIHYCMRCDEILPGKCFSSSQKNNTLFESRCLLCEHD